MSSRPAKQRRCLRCGAKRTLTKDHVIPSVVLRKRGVPQNHESNIQKLCEPCNRWKGAMMVDFRSDYFHDQLIWWMEHVGLSEITDDVIHEPSDFCVGAHWSIP